MWLDSSLLNTVQKWNKYDKFTLLGGFDGVGVAIRAPCQPLKKEE